MTAVCLGYRSVLGIVLAKTGNRRFRWPRTVTKFNGRAGGRLEAAGTGSPELSVCISSQLHVQ